MARFVQALSVLLAAAVTREVDAFSPRFARRLFASKTRIRSFSYDYLDSLSRDGDGDGDGDDKPPPYLDVEVLAGPFITTSTLLTRIDGVGSDLNYLSSSPGETPSTEASTYLYDFSGSTVEDDTFIEDPVAAGQMSEEMKEPHEDTVEEPNAVNVPLLKAATFEEVDSNKESESNAIGSYLDTLIGSPKEAGNIQASTSIGSYLDILSGPTIVDDAADDSVLTRIDGVGSDLNYLSSSSSPRDTRSSEASTYLYDFSSSTVDDDKFIEDPVAAGQMSEEMKQPHEDTVKEPNAVNVPLLEAATFEEVDSNNASESNAIRSYLDTLIGSPREAGNKQASTPIESYLDNLSGPTIVDNAADDLEPLRPPSPKDSLTARQVTNLVKELDEIIEDLATMAETDEDMKKPRDELIRELEVETFEEVDLKNESGPNAIGPYLDNMALSPKEAGTAHAETSIGSYLDNLSGTTAGDGSVTDDRVATGQMNDKNKEPHAGMISELVAETFEEFDLKKASRSNVIGSYLDNLSRSPQETGSKQAPAPIGSYLDNLSRATVEDGNVIEDQVATGQLSEKIEKSREEMIPELEAETFDEFDLKKKSEANLIGSYLDNLARSPKETGNAQAATPRGSDLADLSGLTVWDGNIVEPRTEMIPELEAETFKVDLNTDSGAITTGSYLDNLAGSPRYTGNKQAPALMGSYLDELSDPTAENDNVIEDQIATGRTSEEIIEREEPVKEIKAVNVPLPEAKTDEDAISKKKTEANAIGSYLDNLAGPPKGTGNRKVAAPMGSYLDKLSDLDTLSDSSPVPTFLNNKVVGKPVADDTIEERNEGDIASYLDSLSSGSAAASSGVPLQTAAMNEDAPVAASYLEEISEKCDADQQSEKCAAAITNYFDALASSQVVPSAATGAAITSHLDALSKNSPTPFWSSASTSAAAVTGYLGALSSKAIAPPSTTAVMSYLDGISNGKVELPPNAGVMNADIMAFSLDAPFNESAAMPYTDTFNEPNQETFIEAVMADETARNVPALEPESYAEDPILLVQETPEEVATMEGMSLEEDIVASLAKAKGIGKSEASYVAARESLRDSKARTQRQLGRSAYEIEKATERIAQIVSKMEAEVQEVEEELQTKLDKTQSKIDAEVARIVELLVSRIGLEAVRQEQTWQLMNSLQQSIASKEYEIANEEKFINEILEVRSKLKPGAVAQNLDDLVEQKRTMNVIEQALVDSLFECLLELDKISEDARARAARIDAALNRMRRPVASAPYEWKDIEDMEIVLEQASEEILAAEKRIRKFSQRIDEALVERTFVRGEELPPGLAKAAQRACARKATNTIKSLPRQATLNIDGFLDLKEKDEGELLSMLATSVGRATLSGSEAAVFGIKAVLDTVNDEPVKEATTELLDESKIVKASPNEGIQETASTLGKIGQAGSTVISSLEQNRSAKTAGKALQNTTKDLFDSATAAAALTVKLYDKYKKNFDDIGIEAKEKAAAKERIGQAGGFKRLYQDRVAQAKEEEEDAKQANDSKEQ